MRRDSFALEESGLSDTLPSSSKGSVRAEMPAGSRAVLSKACICRGHFNKPSCLSEGLHRPLPTHCHAEQKAPDSTVTKTGFLFKHAVSMTKR